MGRCYSSENAPLSNIQTGEPDQVLPLANGVFGNCIAMSVALCCPGGVADSVAKWAFRQDLKPALLKGILESRGTAEPRGNPSEGEKNLEDASLRKASGE